MTSMRRIACLTLLALLLGARAYAGPILDYGFFALNLAENAQQFVFTFQSPYALGPYDTLIHEFSSTVTDADGNGGVTVIPTFAPVPERDQSSSAANRTSGYCWPGTSVVSGPRPS